jgi:hypothetical protein
MSASKNYSNMSAEQDWGADTTTQGPPPSYRREGLSIASSSQLSPKSPAPWGNDIGNRSERNSWGEPGEEQIDRRRRSTVTFGGATSVAPSDSISKVKTRSGRGSGDVSAPRTQYDRRSRRRSAPWQDHEYRSTYPSKAGSPQGGTAWSGGAPLTEGNLEEFNERRPPRTEGDVEREVERNVDVEQLDRRSSRKSRRDSGVAAQGPATRAGWIGADDRRTSRQYSRVERGSAPAERALVTTRHKTEVEEDGPDEEEVETKSKSRYENYSRPTQSSISKVSERRRSRAADVYAQASARQSASSVGKQTQKPRTSFTQRSRPPTMPPESMENARSSRDLAVVAAGTTAASRPDGRSKAPTEFFEESNEETRQAEAKSERFSSRRDEGRSRQTEVKSERISEREVVTERKSTAPPTRVSGRSNRQSQAVVRASHAAAAATTAAAAPTSPSSGPSSPTSASSPTAPEALEAHWERRVHIVETRKPDGRVIMDKEYSMRRMWPHQEQQVGA